MNNNRIKALSFSGIILILFIIILILVNVVAEIFVTKNDLKIDISYSRYFSITQKTKDVLKEINDPVKITVFSNEKDFPALLKEYLIKYAKQSSYISLEFINPYKNPNIIAEYQKEGISVVSNSVLVEGPGKNQLIPLLDFYEIDRGTGEATGLLAEQKLTSAVFFVTEKRKKSVIVSDGHGEETGEKMKTLFIQNGFDISYSALGLQNSDINPDILLIPSPKRDFTKIEINKLDSYMSGGGNLFVFLEPGNYELNNLYEFLHEWGIRVTDSIVADDRNNILANPLNIVAEYEPHKINNYFSDKRFFVVMPATRCLEPLFDYGNSITVEKVLSSSTSSYAKNGIDFPSLRQEPDDLNGPFAAVLTASKVFTTPDGIKRSRIFVSGSKAIYSDAILSVDTYANGDFLIQSIKWLSGISVAFNIPGKKFSPEPLSLTTVKAYFLSFLFIIIIPLVLLIIGLIVNYKRKHP